MKTSSDGSAQGTAQKHPCSAPRSTSTMSTSQLLMRFENMHRLGAQKIAGSLKK